MRTDTPKLDKILDFIKELPDYEYKVSNIQQLFYDKTNETVNPKVVRKALNRYTNWICIGKGSTSRWRNINKINDTQTVQLRVEQIKGRYSIKSPYRNKRRLPFNILGFNPVEPQFPVQVCTLGYDKKEKPHEIFDDYSLESIENMLQDGFLQKHKI